jgi:hypothetical protein
MRVVSRSTNDWFAAHGALVLVVAGVAFVVCAFLTDKSSLAVALAVMGVGVVILGVFSSRAEGPVKIGPKGLELYLQAVRRRADELELSERERRILFDRALGQIENYRAVLGLPEEMEFHGQGASDTVRRPYPDERVKEAAEELANNLVASSLVVLCANCEAEIDEQPGLRPEDRKPCPRCGERGRRFLLQTGGSIRPSGSVRLDSTSSAP